MKTVHMTKDFSYQPLTNFPKVIVQYIEGATYKRVPEFAVRAILAADAGKIITEEEFGAMI